VELPPHSSLNENIQITLEMYDSDFVRFQVLTAASMMMEEARTSETSVDNYFSRQYIPEDKSELQ
jgi:hypothetical protein